MAKVGRDLWMSSGLTPELKQGQLELVAQDHVPMAFEFLQGWRLHNLPGQHVPVLRHPHIFRVRGILLYFSVCPLPSVLSPGTTAESLAPFLFAPSLQVFTYIDKIPRPFPSPGSPSSLSLSQYWRSSGPFNHLSGLLLGSLQYVNISHSGEPRTGHSSPSCLHPYFTSS